MADFNALARPGKNHRVDVRPLLLLDAEQRPPDVRRRAQRVEAPLVARPPRVARSTAQSELPLMLLSFMSESRRLANTRLKRELRLVLWYPTVHTGLSA